MFVETLERRFLLAKPSPNLPPLALTLIASGTQWGNSTAYIGAVEGNVRFNVNDLIGAGINTYRVYGGMARWETTDDDGVYGSPSIAQIEANPNVINWAHWDNVMTNPPNGTDYNWVTNKSWLGNARTIFSQLKANNIRPVLTLRTTDNHDKPSWAPNPPVTEADNNEWWEHVFATVYWLNVRNDYRVDDFEIHNEPDNKNQGWLGTQAQYFDFVRLTSDAINYVYDNYLPGRTVHIHAPKTQPNSAWPLPALEQVGDEFDIVNVHNYSADISSYTRKVYGWMNDTGHGDQELWLGEWGTYTGSYASAQINIEVIQNLICGSRPGDDHITGSHIFSMYDWAAGNPKWFKGFVDSAGVPSAGWYAMRMGTRALQGGKATFETPSSDPNIVAITTKDAAGNVYFLVANHGAKQVYNITADLSALVGSGTGTMWKFDATNKDAIVGSPTLSAGKTTFSMPGLSAFLLKFPPGAPINPTAASAQPVAIPITFAAPTQQHAIALLDIDSDTMIGSRDM